MAFKALKIAEPILQALAREGYTKPTPIQEKTIPLLLENKDVIGIAQTGTGKTAAFVVPILQKLYERPSRATSPRALVLAPTRELAAQISASFETYGAFLNFRKLVVYGGGRNWTSDKGITLWSGCLNCYPWKASGFNESKKGRFEPS